MAQSFGRRKVLIINCSPRRGGNTDIITGNILEAAKDAGAFVDKIVLNDLKLRFYQESDEPDADGKCHFEDDMAAIYAGFKEANAVIMASPIYFGSLSGQAKVMIDRFQCAWTAKHILKKDMFPERKMGAFVAVAASERRDFFENARAIVRNLFATLNIEYKKELYFTGIDQKGDILKHPDLLQKAYRLGKEITEEING